MSASSPSGGVVGAAAAATAQISMENLQMPPLRSLDDFILGSARFQLPNVKDLEKWGNRVVKNLLYYQTNYFLMLLSIYLFMAALSPVKIISGLLVQTKLLAVYLHFFRSSGCLKSGFIASRAIASKEKTEANQLQKWYFLVGASLFGFLLLYWLEAILLSCFTLLLPISLTFIHASLRLRNISNKMANIMEGLGSKTPMGVLLDALNVTLEHLLN